ncbi:MAG: glycosyltransferase, partial [Okeania sp. SIO2D1]|nr:glycosyltransferase [Okeania sp. SIO2D1]
MRILFLTTILARKKELGGEISTQAFIDALNRLGHEVSVLGYCRKNRQFEKNSQEIVIGARYIETAKTPKIYTLLWLIQSWFKALPYSAVKFFSRSYINTVKQILSKDKFDFVIVDHSRLGWLEKFLNSQDKLVLISHNVEHEIYLDSYKAASNIVTKAIYRREAFLTQAMQEQLAGVTNQVWAYTKYDAEYFCGLDKVGQVKVFSIPPGLGDLQPSKRVTKEFDIGLLGNW